MKYFSLILVPSEQQYVENQKVFHLPLSTLIKIAVRLQRFLLKGYYVKGSFQSIKSEFRVFSIVHLNIGKS